MKKPIKVDPLYKSIWILKLINKLIRGGNKNKILSRVYSIFSKGVIGLDLELMFMESLEILRVPLALKKVSKKHKVSFPISEYFQYKQSLCWIVNSVKKKKQSLEKSIVEEIKYIVSFNNSCSSLKFKKEYEQLLYKNRFFKGKSK